MTTAVIWNEYHQQLRSFILKKIGDINLTEDILQNVFLKIHSEINKSPRIGNLRALLYKITKNTIIDHYRTSKKNSSLADKDKFEAEDEHVISDVASSIRFFINQLKEPYRTILVMSELKNMSQKEIAVKLAIPYSTIKSRVQRGRDQVKRMMLDCCHYEFDLRGNVVDYECKRC